MKGSSRRAGRGPLKSKPTWCNPDVSGSRRVGFFCFLYERNLMTASNGSTLVGIFQSRYEAELALDELRQAGFDHKDIGFAIRGDDSGSAGMITDSLLTKDGHGAAKGMLAGGIAGSLVGAAAV